MNCEDCQIAISDSIDQGAKELSTDVVAHMTGCPECRKFRQISLELDLQLTSKAAPALPDNFRSRLDARVAEYPRLLPAEIAERRKQYEREYAESLALLQHRYFFPSAMVLAQLILFVLAWGLFGGLLGRLVLALPAALVAASDERLFPLCAWAVTFAICLYGVRYFRRPLFDFAPRSSA